MRIRSRFYFKINNVQVVSFFAMVILFITSWAPFAPLIPLGTDALRRILNYLIWLLIGASLVIGPKRKIFNSFELIAVLSVVVFRIVNIINAYEYKGLGISTIILCVFFCLQTDEIRSNVFKWFRYVMVISAIIGIICYISYYLHLGIPYTIVERSKGIEFLDYKLIYLMNQYGSMIRFNGIFEEPGWFGTWAAFYLCADDLKFRKKGDIALLIGGILTFSLAFFLILGIYYIVKNLSDWKRWIWLIILAALFFFVVPNIRTGVYAIDRVFERLTITENGLAGDNRSGPLFQKVWENTIQSGKILLGQGAGYSERYGTGEGEGLASIKSYIVDFGIIGTIIIFAPLFITSVYRAVKTRNKLMLLYILINFISLYQRPYLFQTPHFYIYLGGISYTFRLLEEKRNTIGLLQGIR